MAHVKRALLAEIDTNKRTSFDISEIFFFDKHGGVSALIVQREKKRQLNN